MRSSGTRKVIRLSALIKRFNGKCFATLFINGAPLNKPAEWEQSIMTSTLTRLRSIRPDATEYFWEIVDVNSADDLKQNFEEGQEHVK